MPASITLSRVSWSTPDGRSLFSGLNLGFGPERAGLVGRNGTGKTTLLKLISSELRPHSGSVAVNGILGILRQTVHVDPSETIVDLFGIAEALDLLRRAESGEATAEELADADWTLEARVAAALDRLRLEVEPETRLAAMSGGQRTRARLAALLFVEPDLLLLDEPTNNLDREGRAAVIELLANWRSGAIVVSHDRELLETMDAIVELTSLGAARYGGNWSQYRECKVLEHAAARRDLADAEKNVLEVDRKAQAATERKARKDRAGQRKRAKGDMPRILAGTNGSGKTTFLALVTGQLRPWTGTVRAMTDFAVVDQQVSLLDQSASIRDNFRRLNPQADENACRAALARFMFRADAALEVVSSLSGGQLLRAGLACVLGGPMPPPLLILDEPTNHLDIDSIEAVEAGLRAYDSALLIVSHDETFLEAIAVLRRMDLTSAEA
ncbi:ABC-F family ATP-binding cassette domain-containing protein [Microvirga sp. 3-52]|nr:ABC-F family ATP-binding cassette domain-containing protein [Microvirga sp. 3-52]